MSLEERLQFLFTSKDTLEKAITCNSEYIHREEQLECNLLEEHDFNVIKKELHYQTYQLGLIMTELKQLFQQVLHCNRDKLAKYELAIQVCKDTSGNLSKHLKKSITAKKQEISRFEQLIDQWSLDF
jgi:hypothetical protein